MREHERGIERGLAFIVGNNNAQINRGRDANAASRGFRLEQSQVTAAAREASR